MGGGGARAGEAMGPMGHMGLMFPIIGPISRIRSLAAEMSARPRTRPS